MDKKPARSQTINITGGEGSQVVFGQDDATIHATMNVSSTKSKELEKNLTKLLSLLEKSTELTPESKENLIDLSDIAQREVASGQPSKSTLAKLNTRLESYQHLFTGGSLLASTSSAVMDGIQTLLK